MINTLFWRLVAFIVSRGPLANWLIARAKRTPYSHITSRDGSEVYMERYWLFNPYRKRPDCGAAPARWSWLPSIRLHWIRAADSASHMHDHPWNARTIVLRGFYWEQKFAAPGTEVRTVHTRKRGYTGRILFGEYHHISTVSICGVWTMFFTWDYRGTWGFWRDGAKVPYREYLAETRQERV